MKPLSLEMVGGTLALQIFLILLGGILLDGGMMGRIFIAATAVHWGGILLIAIRRRNRLTKGDEFYIRWGYLWICVAVAYFPWVLDWGRRCFG